MKFENKTSWEIWKFWSQNPPPGVWNGDVIRSERYKTKIDKHEMRNSLYDPILWLSKDHIRGERRCLFLGKTMQTDRFDCG